MTIQTYQWPNQTCQGKATYLYSYDIRTPYLKLSPLPSGTGKYVREPPGHIGNEPTPDIHRDGFRQAKNGDKYMQFIMDMVIICKVDL